MFHLSGSALLNQIFALGDHWRFLNQRSVELESAQSGRTWPWNHRKYLSTAITRNFSMNNSESRTAMWAALQKFRSNPRTNVTSHLPIIELVLFGRAWWMSYLTSSQVSDCKILNNYQDDYPKKIDNFNLIKRHFMIKIGRVHNWSRWRARFSN